MQVILKNILFFIVYNVLKETLDVFAYASVPSPYK